MSELELLQRRLDEIQNPIGSDIQASLLACMEAAEQEQGGLSPAVVIKLVDDVIRLTEENLRLVDLNEEVHNLAITDELTGLKNRRAFDNVLDREVRKADRYNNPLSLVMMDIDRFKTYNDKHGHPEGDSVLQCLARIMENGVRQDIDFPVRYGGEEFAIILPETNLYGGMQAAEKLREAIEEQMKKDKLCSRDEDGKEIHKLLADITVSFGVATWEEGNTSDDFLRKADIALYKAKEGGRNRVEVFREEVE
ncbi:MAG: GGDEF domain-containing protein [Candidatus Beckwithbacteria bacterium]